MAVSTTVKAAFKAWRTRYAKKTKQSRAARKAWATRRKNVSK